MSARRRGGGGRFIIKKKKRLSLKIKKTLRVISFGTQDDRYIHFENKTTQITIFLTVNKLNSKRAIS